MCFTSHVSDWSPFLLSLPGYALLTDDVCARAAAEREKLARAVERERVRATKEAASKLAEAQLMDVLFSGPSEQS